MLKMSALEIRELDLGILELERKLQMGVGKFLAKLFDFVEEGSVLVLEERGLFELGVEL